MHINNHMIQAAVNKATELGVLPRKGISDDIATNNELMVQILQAALDAERDAGGQIRSDDTDGQ